MDCSGQNKNSQRKKRKSIESKKKQINEKKSFESFFLFASCSRLEREKRRKLKQSNRIERQKKTKVWIYIEKKRKSHERQRSVFICLYETKSNANLM